MSAESNHAIADPARPSVGKILVTVGRHKGKTLDQCPPDYLAWLVASSKCPTYRLAAAELLGLKLDPAGRPQPERIPDRLGGAAAPEAKPVFLTDAALDELLAVLFRFADELDAMAERVHRLEAVLQAHGIDFQERG